MARVIRGFAPEPPINITKRTRHTERSEVSLTKQPYTD